MYMNDYQVFAKRTDIGNEPPDFHGIELPLPLCWALGLAGEAGEYVEIIKKEYYHRKRFNREAKLKELGDILWYLAIAADYEGFTLEEVARSNLEKLRTRYPNGFRTQE